MDTMKTRHISIMFDLGLVGRSRRETGRSVLSTCVTLRQVEETLTLVVSFTLCTFHAKATTFPPLGFGGGVGGLHKLDLPQHVDVLPGVLKAD